MPKLEIERLIQTCCRLHLNPKPTKERLMLKLLRAVTETTLFDLKELGEITLNEEELLADLHYGRRNPEATLDPPPLESSKS